MSEEPESNLTPAQQDALNRCEQIMKEHFDAAVLVISCSHETVDKADVIEATFTGGYAAAIGLCDLGKDMVKRTKDLSRE